VDYAQDVGRVDEWAAEHAALVDLLVPRGVDPPKGSRPLLETPVVDVLGWVAVSATQLTAIHRDELSWLRAYCPVRTIGGSVMIYWFASPPDPTPGPTMPADVCSGDVSVRAG
jgi:hypothetical protein